MAGGRRPWRVGCGYNFDIESSNWDWRLGWIGASGFGRVGT